MENLIIGYDLGDMYSRISWYNEKKGEPEAVAVLDNGKLFKLPTVLCLKPDGTWLAGAQAEAAISAHVGTEIRNFVQNYEAEPEVEVAGQHYEKKFLIQKYIEMTLNLLRQYVESYTIRYMTVTVEQVSKDLISGILEIAPDWGVPEHAIRVQSHIASFENFVMSQKKELWQQDVGLFEYDEAGMNYYHLTIQNRRQASVVNAQTVPLKMYMSGQMYHDLSPVDLDRQFLEVLNQVLSQKIISTIFLTGSGFDGKWLNLSLKRMCIPGRRVFIEENIYAAGACYSGLLDVEGRSLKQFVALDDDIIPYNIYIRGSRMKEVSRVDFVQGGECWYRIGSSQTVLLDDTDTIVIHAKDLLTNVEKLIPLKLEGLPDRPDRTITIEINVQFESKDICCFTMTDKGFGGLFPSSQRKWVKRINIDGYEWDKNYKESGRLIFVEPAENRTPYYFNISHTKIYSVEELCYYIYHNIYAISTETFGEDLFYWLEKSAKQPTLCKGLRGLKKSNASLRTMVQYLMNWSDYYKSGEYHQLLLTLEDIERQNPLETRKNKADSLVRYCRYMEAVSEYTIVAGQMDNPEYKDMTRKFKSEVYHNMACAYMRLMNFGAAAINYKKAYDCGKNSESLKCYLWTLKLRGNDSEFFAAVEEYHLEQSYIDEIMQVYTQAEQSMVMGQRPDDDETKKVVKRLKEAYRS